VQAAIENGADLNDVLEGSSMDFDLEKLYAHRDILLTRETATQFLKKALFILPTEWNSIENKSELSHDKVAIQKELVQAAIENGADLNDVLEDHSIYTSLETLSAQKDILLTKETATQFLKKALFISPIEWSSITNKSELSHDKVAIQKELVQAAIENGADLNAELEAHSTYTSLETLSAQRDILLTRETATQFLKKALSISPTEWNSIENKSEFSQEKIEIQEELIKASFELSGHTRLTSEELHQALMSSRRELIEYLIDNNRFNIDCDIIKKILEQQQEAWHHIANEVPEEFSSDPALLLSYKYRNLSAKEGNDTKIPPILHHIWLTSADSPKQVREQDIANAIKTHKMLTSSLKHNWTQIVWVNDKSLLKESVEKLEAEGIKVREVSEVGDHLYNYDIFQEQLSKKYWGLSTDILRYDLVNYMGGVYADINYIFSKAPDRELNTYDFFSVTYSPNYMLSIDNFIFGAKPYHPVIKKTQEIVERNFNNPPPYIEAVYNQSINHFTDLATANPIGFGYFNAAHQDGNVDVIYPRWSSHDRNNNYYGNQDIDYERDMNDMVNTNVNLYCPDLNHSMQKMQEDKMKRLEYMSYVMGNEFCPADDYIIGEDSTDGRTWASGAE